MSKMDITPYIKNDTILKMPLAVFEQYHSDVKNPCIVCRGAGFPIKVHNGIIGGHISQTCKACLGTGNEGGYNERNA